MRVHFQRDLPHSMLEIRHETDDLVVYPHAPSERRFIREADALLFHVHTASAPRIKSFIEDCVPLIVRIQRALPQPPTDGAEEIYPAAEAMTAIAEQMGF